MVRKIAVGLVMFFLCVVLSSNTLSMLAANRAEGPDIEEIMKKLNKPKGLHKAVGKALDADSVDWATVAPMTKEYAKLAGHLGKNKPEKGGAASWAKLCKAYADDAAALAAAAGKKDKASAKTAWGKLNKSCQECHDEHR